MLQYTEKILSRQIGDRSGTVSFSTFLSLRTLFIASRPFPSLMLPFRNFQSHPIPSPLLPAFTTAMREGPFNSTSHRGDRPHHPSPSRGISGPPFSSYHDVEQQSNDENIHICRGCYQCLEINHLQSSFRYDHKNKCSSCHRYGHKNRLCNYQSAQDRIEEETAVTLIQKDFLKIVHINACSLLAHFIEIKLLVKVIWISYTLAKHGFSLTSLTATSTSLGTMLLGLIRGMVVARASLSKTNSRAKS